MNLLPRAIRDIVKAACATQPFCRALCWHVSCSERAVAVTFDDGPSADYTCGVLEVLERFGAEATFFVLGEEIEKNPEVTDRLVRAGHDIGNHGYDHVPERLPAQVKKCEEILACYGVKSPLFRPPGGTLTLPDFLWLWRSGYTTVLWSFDLRDSMRYEGKWYRPVLPFDSIRAGDIVLMHDDNPICVQQLPILMQALLDKRLRCVTVSALLSASRGVRERAAAQASAPVRCRKQQVGGK